MKKGRIGNRLFLSCCATPAVATLINPDEVLSHTHTFTHIHTQVEMKQTSLMVRGCESREGVPERRSGRCFRVPAGPFL